MILNRCSNQIEPPLGPVDHLAIGRGNDHIRGNQYRVRVADQFHLMIPTAPSGELPDDTFQATTVRYRLIQQPPATPYAQLL